MPAKKTNWSKLSSEI